MEDLEQTAVMQFNSWAKNYDQKQNWQYYFSNRGIVHILNPQNGAAILDVGCATGVLLHQLSQLNRNLNLHGIDIAPEMIRVAKNKLGRQAIIREGSANKLPYKNNFFNYITCATSFHHYPDPEHSLREMLRVLKPRGKLILLDPFKDGLLRKTICILLDIIFRETDTHLFTSNQMHRMFQKVGFKDVKQETYMYYKLITIGTKDR